MTRIVTTSYRPKRPPRKRKAVALDLPAIVRAAVLPKAAKRPPAQPADAERPVIVRTKSRRASAFGDAPDMTADEHQRRGEAADALRRELVRRTTVGE